MTPRATACRPPKPIHAADVLPMSPNGVTHVSGPYRKAGDPVFQSAGAQSRICGILDTPRSRSMTVNDGAALCLKPRCASVHLDERAAALVERTERLVAGHGGEQLVEIPFILGLFRLLHLEQIHVVDHAAVDADLAAMCEE